MRIGINLLYLIPDVVGGTETYAAGLLSGLSQIDQENDFFLFVNQSAADWPIPENKNFIRVICPVKGLLRYQRYFFEQCRLPELLSQYKIDLVHSLAYVGPLRSPCPSVITIHDLNFIDLAQTIGVSRRFVLRFFSTQTAKRANHVLTISNFSKERLCKKLKIPKQKITVILLSADNKIDVNPSIQADELLRHYGIKKPYILAFGSSTLHKNISPLIQAFALLKDSLPHNLVLVGHLPPDVNLSVLFSDPDMNGRLIATGYVPNNHVGPLLSGADLFVFPSLYEGFGLPLLEAQKADVAVACSSAGSLPEIAGKSAVFFDPSSVSAMAQTIYRCLSDDNLRTELRRLGRENLSRFSWRKTAAETLAVYKRILN